MITTKDVKIKIPEEFTSEYVEDELKKMGLDVLRWAITDFDKEFYTLNIAIVKD
ncbi:MAG: hypothetical protein LUH11_00360 [Candidatus Gastranaerophilales bacterium]|nr:hypothetical protein [Candidatus Gastranaerophilales bacterium]